MNKCNELLDKGLIPEYITVELMSNIMNGLPLHIVKRLAEGR